MTAYYNEHDPFAAAWLRELIKDGLIAPGEVDERDIRDVVPNELRSFRQVHLFAGIGIWSAALRDAGWPDDRAAWTVSCPCQPFSQAGGRGGFTDERHLWPAAFHLIGQCGPDVVLGEQSSSKDGLAWFDLVQADMEAAGYSGGSVDICSAGFGAPNIRQRQYFVWLANADIEGSQGRAGMPERAAQCFAGKGGMAGRMANALRDGAEHAPGQGVAAQAEVDGGDRGLSGQRLRPGVEGPAGRPGPVNSFWRDADWIGCTDGKWRPAEPGTFPLVTGYPNRVGILRGAGNALNKEVAQGFVEAVMAEVPAHKHSEAP